MASKKELLQAQTFSRRRLLTAFVSGAPGGRELEPAKPLRGVVIGAVLSVLVVVGTLIAGTFVGSPDDDWKVNSLVVVSDTGARYIAINGELYPVHNVTSGRLLAFSEDFQVLSLDEEEVQDVPRGTITVGIPGAPDALPPATNLIDDAWLSCAVDAEHVWTSLSVSRQAPEQPSAALVEVDGQAHYVHGGYRYEVSDEDLNSLSHFLHFDPTAAVPVNARWLNIFTEGTPLAPLPLPEGGAEPPGPAADLDAELQVGSVVVLRNTQGETGAPHVLDSGGQLVELNPLALELYGLASGHSSEDVIILDHSQARQLEINRDADLVPADWPTQISEMLTEQGPPCVQLQREEDGEPVLHVTSLAQDTQIGAAPVEVDAGHGALVRLDGGGAQGPWAIIDERGTLYQVPPGHEQELQRLGYAEIEAPPVPARWAALFPAGPDLTIEAAESGLPLDVQPEVADPEDEQGGSE